MDESKMKDIIIESFTDLYDATIFIEDMIETFIDNGHTDIKGEITLIDGKWRASVIADDRQMEMDI